LSLSRAARQVAARSKGGGSGYLLSPGPPNLLEVGMPDQMGSHMAQSEARTFFRFVTRGESVEAIRSLIRPGTESDASMRRYRFKVLEKFNLLVAAAQSPTPDSRPGKPAGRSRM